MSRLPFAARLRRFVLALMTLGAASAFAEPLWNGNRAIWTIAVHSAADEVVQYAAQELKEALDHCSGANFLIGNTLSPNRPTILVASMEDKVIKPRAAKFGLVAGPDEICVVKLVKSNLLVILGNQPRAALHGVYAFLHDTVGVRWLWAGDDGAFYPHLKSFTLPQKLDRRYTPSICYRGYHLCGEWYDVDNFRIWMARNCLNTHCHANFNKPTKLGFHATSGGHILAIYSKAVFDEHPEWFTYINGERHPSNLCFSNREAANYVAEQISKTLAHLPECLYFNMFAADNQDFCTCEDCKKNSVSTNLFRFRNWVVEILHRKYPHQQFAGLAYSSYLDVPKCELEHADLLQFATHDRCNNHRLDDPDCSWNRKVLQYFREWGALGLPIGQYGYEFDVYLDKGLAQFTPFFSLIEDSVKTAVKFKHRLVIPEVPLSPKEGPPIEVGSVVNRLPIAYYAQAMWDANLTADAFLADTAKTVWGPAEKPMYAYFKLLDAAWCGVKSHTIIIKNPMSIAGSFLKPETLKKAHELLDETRSLIAQNPKELADYPTYDPERAQLALEREIELLRRWEGYVGTVRGERPRLTLPALSAGSKGPLKNGGGKLRDASGEPSGYVVRLAWDPTTAEIVVYFDGLGKRRMTGATRLEAAFMPESSAAQVVFSPGAEVKKRQWRISETGIVDKKWKAEWTVETDEKGTMLRIPLKHIAPDLGAGKSLNAHFSVATKRDKPPEFLFPATGTTGAILQLSNLAQVDRMMLIWLGAPSLDQAKRNVLVDDAAKCGWKAYVTDDEGELREYLKHQPELVWLRYPEKENCLSDKTWRNLSRLAKETGLIIACSSLWQMPLERCLGDPKLGLTWANIENLDVGSRKFEFVADGEWGERPYPVAKALRKGITGPYSWFPKVPKAWEILARQYNYPNKPPVPCIMLQRRGKGSVLVFAHAISLNAMQLLTNIASQPQASVSHGGF